MTPDETRPGDEPDLDTADERSVSDLLASVSQDSPPMPADVASRLDDVLGALAADRAGAARAPQDAPVTDLTHRQDERENRRWARRWPQVLVAAAAASVVGLGIGSLVDDLGSGSSDSLSAGSAAEQEAASDAPAARKGGPNEGGPVEGGLDQGAGKSALPDAAAERLSLQLARLQRLRSDSLAADAQRLANLALPVPAALDSSDDGSAAAPCEVPDTEEGDEVYAVRLDREPATIVFRRAEDGVRQADVYACHDAGEPVATTFVSVP